MNCATTRQAIESIESLAELEGFIWAVKNPDIKTKPVTDEDRQALNLKWIEWKKNAARKKPAR